MIPLEALQHKKSPACGVFFMLKNRGMRDCLPDADAAGYRVATAPT